MNLTETPTYSSPIIVKAYGANLLFLKSELLGPVRIID